MRLHRLQLRNFRGVDECTVELAIDGVTIIEGDNEIGKTSLAEALDLLLHEPDSSAKRRIRSIRPVHRDAGPEAEVDMSCGTYRFTYRKRWQRRPETTLRILSPQPEQLTGREAHDRVAAILDETLDSSLLRALQVHQGIRLESPSFDIPALVEALDRAAGGDTSCRDDDGLWDLIRAERAKYWTPTGRPNSERTSLVERANAAAEDARELEAGLEAARIGHPRVGWFPGVSVGLSEQDNPWRPVSSCALWNPMWWM